jgi:hypothetical protein
MRYPTDEDLKALAAHEGSASVSLYMPTHHAEPSGHQHPTRFSNLLRRAETQLEASTVPEQSRLRILEQMQERAADETYWRDQRDGLAMFVTSDGRLEYPLSYPVAELVTVGQRFHLTPALPLPGEQQRFFIAAVSLSGARLFEAYAHQVQELELKGSGEQIGREDVQSDREQALQFHTGAPRDGGTRRHAIYHGQGGGKDTRDHEVRQHLRAIDDHFRNRIDDPDVPVVIASVDYLRPIYGEVTRLSNVLHQGAEGNPDELTAEQLRDRCWPLVHDHLVGTAADFEEQLGHQVAAGRASRELEAILSAAHDGRVETLYVPRGQPCWGTFDRASRSVQAHSARQHGDEDLYSLAAIQTLRNGGQAYGGTPALLGEQPSNPTELAALFRY